MEPDTPSGSREALLPPPEGSATDASLASKLKLAFRLSWLVNWLLLGLKVLAVVVSGSKAVLASTADSAGKVMKEARQHLIKVTV